MNADQYHLRLFLTPKCTLRCVYCNDRGAHTDQQILDTEMIKAVITEARALGIRRVHYTGGEPTVRDDLISIVQHAKAVGFDEQVISTNGTTFYRIAEELHRAGLTRVSISLDTMDPKRFKMITAVAAFGEVMQSITMALRIFGAVKLNTVVMKLNVDEIPTFLDFSASTGGALCRFIELNPNNPSFFWNEAELSRQHVGREEILSRIGAHIGELERTEHGGENPNCEYYRSKRNGLVFGTITNASLGFRCGDCHKLRVSPYGEVGACIASKRTAITRADGISTTLSQAIEERERLASPRRHYSAHFGQWRFGDLASERETVYIIKPDAFDRRNDILSEIRAAGFAVVSSTDTVLDEGTVRDLYPEEDGKLVEFMVDYLAGKRVQAGVLRKDSAVRSFIQLVGWHADPRKCDPSSIRRRYGCAQPLLRSGREYYHNAVHRTVQTDVDRELALYWERIMHPSVIAAVKRLVADRADTVDRIKYHNDPVVRNGLALAERVGANRSVVEIACYLHDITRMSGDAENHHVSGGRVAEELLASFNYPSEKISLIKKCILNHRGSVESERATIEEKVVAAADAMAHIQYPLPLFYKMLVSSGQPFDVGREAIRRKLQRSWAKICFPHVCDEMADRYHLLLDMTRE